MTAEPGKEHKTQASGAFHAADGNMEVINLRQLFISLWSHKLIIVGTTMIALCCAYFYLSLTKPVYQSRAELKISADNLDMQQVSVRTLFTGGSVNSSIVRSEVAVLKSRSRLEKLARHLGLYRIGDMETFTMDGMPEMKSANDINQFKSLDLSPRSDDNENGPPDEPDSEVIERIANNLSVRNVANTVIIEINYASSNRYLAKAIPQALAHLYIKQTLKNKLQSSRRLREWLNKRLGELRDRLRQAEEKIADFQSKNNFLIDDKSNLLLKRLTATNQQIIQTQSELSGKRLKLEQARKILKTNSEQALAAVPFDNSTSVSALKQQERRLLNKKAEAMTRYGSKHPEIQSVKAELDAVRKEMRAAIRERIDQLENEVELLATRLQEREQDFKTLRESFNNKKAAMVKLQELKRNAQSTKEIYDSFLKKYKRAIDTKALEQPDAELISEATLPKSPVFPKNKLIYALSGISGITVGLILVVIMMMTRDSYANLRELESDGLDTLGIVPKLKRRERRKHDHDIVQSDQQTPIGEALRNIYMNIRLRSHQRDKAIQVIAMTSTVSGEGKTSISGWLAQTAGGSGVSVCVVDADMRKPGQHNFFRLDTGYALVDYLGGHAGLDDIIQHSTDRGVDVITSRSSSGALSDLLNGDSVEQLINQLRQRYDLIIIDTPALLAVPDARFITLYADQIAYLVSWNETGRDMLERGIKSLNDVPDDCISAILSKVNIRRQARHGDSDMVYYYNNTR